MSWLIWIILGIAVLWVGFILYKRESDCLKWRKDDNRRVQDARIDFPDRRRQSPKE